MQCEEDLSQGSTSWQAEESELTQALRGREPVNEPVGIILGMETKARGEVEKINEQSFIFLPSRAIEIWW